MKQKYILIQFIILLIGSFLLENTGTIKNIFAEAKTIDLGINKYRQRVIAESGLIVRQEPSIKAKKMYLIPSGVHVWVIKESESEVYINNIKNKWKYIEFISYKDPLKIIKGWVFGGYLGAIEMKLTSFMNPAIFESGCIGPGCNVCGAYVFDSDKTFFYSQKCGEKPIIGSWILIDDTLQACIGKNCKVDPYEKNIWIFHINKVGNIELKKNDKKEIIHSGFVYWEPHGWENLK